MFRCGAACALPVGVGCVGWGRAQGLSGPPGPARKCCGYRDGVGWGSPIAWSAHILLTLVLRAAQAPLPWRDFKPQPGQGLK